MKTITIGVHPTYKMPVFGFEGTPTGIDIRKVIQTNSAPIIDTAIAHKEPGYPKIGAGLVRAPMECFKKALIAFSRKYQSTEMLSTRNEGKMVTGVIIRKNQYYDSVFLMGFNNRLSKMDGVIQTAVLMGSDANKEVLADLGFVNAEVKTCYSQ